MTEIVMKKFCAETEIGAMREHAEEVDMRLAATRRDVKKMREMFEGKGDIIDIVTEMQRDMARLKADRAALQRELVDVKRELCAARSALMVGAR